MQYYESEFQAPNYTIVDKRQVGLKVITTVIMDGQMIEFEADRATVTAGKKLEDHETDS